MDDGFLTSIGNGRTIALMLKLRDGPCIMKDLKEIVLNFQSLKIRLNEMEKDGLVNVTTSLDGHKYVVVELTDLGKEIAMLFSITNMAVSPNKNISEKSIDMKHFDTVVRLLRGKEYMVQREIVKNIKTFDTVIRVLDAMESDGLVIKEEVHEGVRQIRYSLTPLGEQIADVFESVHQKMMAV